MGSWGSGRWGCHRKATTVEECRVLDLAQFARKGGFVEGFTGSVTWSRGEEQTDEIGFSVGRADTGELVLSLSYRMSTTKENVEVPIRLETTPTPSGGRRWWGICPLIVNGNPCDRRLYKVYLPPGGKYFGCRHCHRLTYKTAQEHDQRVTNLRRNPAAIEAILDRLHGNLSNGQLALAMKAAWAYRDELLHRASKSEQPSRNQK